MEMNIYLNFKHLQHFNKLVHNYKKSYLDNHKMINILDFYIQFICQIMIMMFMHM